ncbi:MAG: hypothetical protein ACTSQ7_05955 [Alphaproteobacteria bacterium]
MPQVRGCPLPDELLYDVENHIWFQEIGDGNLRIGMTPGTEVAEHYEAKMDADGFAGCE